MYQPEIGQACFGQPYKEHEVSKLGVAALRAIEAYLDIVMWNRHQKIYVSPFGNNGAEFKNDTFEVESYSWGEEEQPYNFKWKDVEVSWYKYLGRGTTSNIELTPNLLNDLLDDCLASLQRGDIS